LRPAVEPVSYAAFASAVRRPLYSALDSVTLPAAGLTPAPAWEEGLNAFLRERENRRIASR
jgi:dTDP-4-dehydrorhamnose reductase